MLPAQQLSMLPGCVSACPACGHRQLTSAASAQQKLDFLQKKLTAWSAVISNLQTVADDGRWHYRDRATLSCQWQGTAWQFGVMHRDELIAIPNCPVHRPRINHALAVLAELLPDDQVLPLRYVVFSAAQIILVVKARAYEFPMALLTTIRERLIALGYEALWLHLNPCTGKRIFSKNSWQLLWGEIYSRNELGFVYSRTAFQQVIPVLYQQSLMAAANFLSPDGNDAVIDLYSGIGVSLAQWLGRGAQVLGVESSADAVVCAGINAPAAQVLRGYCATRLPQIQQWLAERSAQRQILYANPPRAGLEQEVLVWLASSFRPQLLAYLSCSPGSLARDLQCLHQAGYQVEQLIPYDFFPQTRHVEVLALLRAN